MNKLKIYFFLLTIAAHFTGCVGNDNSTTSGVQADNYKYSFFDTSGNSFMEGTMKLISKGEKLSGEYSVDSSAYDKPSGFSSLPGILSGNINTKDMKIFLNLNPKLADNNIFVYADLIADSLSGYWIHSTMAGIKEKGDFKAVKLMKK